MAEISHMPHGTAVTIRGRRSGVNYVRFQYEKPGYQEKNNVEKIDSKKDESPAQLIDARIKELNDWRGENAIPAPRPD